MSESGTVTIFDRIGGDDAVAAVVELFYAKVLADPELSGWFGGVDMAALKMHQRRFVGHALGSRVPYTGREMAAAHRNLAVTDAAFDRVVGHLAAALGEAGVDDATIATIAGALAPLRPDIVTA